MPLSSIARDVFEGLPGVWTLARSIEDARLGAGAFDGTARFTAHDGALLYEERGEIALGVWRGPAWRRWLYVCSGDLLVIRYPDTNADLHAFRFAPNADGGASAQHVHNCGEDRYYAHLRSGPNGTLTLTLRVTGPAKDYRLHTTLSRAA